MDEQRNEVNINNQIQTEIHLKSIQPINLNNRNSCKSDNKLKRKTLDKADLYKTEMCKSFKKFGFCKYNNKCQFAHEEKELRDVSRHPRYKTEICKTFSLYGDCNYGNRCCFLHDENIDSNKEINTEISLDKIIEINYQTSVEKGKRIHFKNDDERLNDPSSEKAETNEKLPVQKFEYKIQLRDERMKLLEIKTNSISIEENCKNIIGYPTKPKVSEKYRNILNDYLKENL